MTRELNITIKRWAAWAPGIETQSAWQQWVNGEATFEPTPPPKPDIPAMLRRRLSTTGKIALHCALHCLHDEQSLPTIFCSRHGELNRTIGMLGDLADQQPLSPTAFSLSVHNANSGIFSIARGDQSPSSAISAGENSLMMGFIEAVGQLAEGNSAEVLVIISDEPLPEPLTPFQETFNHPYGAAFLVTLDQTEGETFKLSVAKEPTNSPPLPQALQLIQQLLQPNAHFTVHSAEQAWQWQRCYE